MSSTDQEDKKPEADALLMDNAITSNLHASKENVDVGNDAIDEQHDSDIEKDDVIISQSKPPDDLTMFESNVSAESMTLGII
eukprot:11275931-Ditylum_brightwellii.AAC.1